MATKAKIGILGASGYTGSELVRMLLRHPRAEIVLLTADRSAGQAMRDVFPQFSPFELPTLVAIEGLDWGKAGLDLVFCALPHATTQKVLKDLLAKAPATKVVDLSADFRLARHRRLTPNGTATSITRPSCRRRRSMASPKSTGARSGRRGWSPIRAATPPARNCR